MCIAASTCIQFLNFSSDQRPNTHYLCLGSNTKEAFFWTGRPISLECITSEQWTVPLPPLSRCREKEIYLNLSATSKHIAHVQLTFIGGFNNTLNWFLAKVKTWSGGGRGSWSFKYLVLLKRTSANTARKARGGK